MTTTALGRRKVDEGYGRAIPWAEALKKEARGVDSFDLGEVQRFTGEYVLTKKGVVRKKYFTIPKSLVVGFDGSTLWFNLLENQVPGRFGLEEQRLVQQQHQLREEAKREPRKEIKKESVLVHSSDCSIPIIEKKFDAVTNKVISDYVVITNIPVAERRTIQVPVKVTVERKPYSGLEAAGWIRHGQNLNPKTAYSPIQSLPNMEETANIEQQELQRVLSRINTPVQISGREKEIAVAEKATEDGGRIYGRNYSVLESPADSSRETMQGQSKTSHYHMKIATFPAALAAITCSLSLFVFLSLRRFREVNRAHQRPRE